MICVFSINALEVKGTSTLYIQVCKGIQVIHN